MIKPIKYVEVAEEDALDMQVIMEAAQKALEAEHNIKIAPPKAIATIGYQFIKQAIIATAAASEQGAIVEKNLFNLLTIGIEHSDIEGEKDGNFVPFVEAGQEMKLLVKSDGDTEE